MCDPDPTMHVVYIYCSVIKENLVGTQYLPLLRVVATNGRHGRMIHVAFDNPQYIQVAYDRISSIKLTLCNDQGNPSSSRLVKPSVGCISDQNIVLLDERDCEHGGGTEKLRA